MRLGESPHSSTELDARPLTARAICATLTPDTKGSSIMAKDKGKKDKGEKPGKAKGGDDFANPSEAPAGSSDGFKAEHDDNVGKLFLITPLREEEIDTDYGRKPAIFADVVIVNEKKPEKSETHENVAFWGGWSRGSLRGFIGKRRVLAVLGKGEPRKKGESAPWMLNDASAAQVEAAKAYLASVDPFAQ